MTRKRILGVLAAIAVVLLGAAYGYHRHGLGYAIWWIFLMLLIGAETTYLYRRRKGKPRGAPPT